MANLSQDDCNSIKHHPLPDSLGYLRGRFEKKKKFLSTNNNSDQKLQEAVMELLGALALSGAASHIISKRGNRVLANDILELRQRVHKEGFNYDNYRQLVQLVLQKASDSNIWAAVFDLINTLSHVTPPTSNPPSSIPPSFDGTPVTHTSSSFQGQEQTKRLLEVSLFHEIKDCTYRDVDGFFSKYFDGKKWTESSKEIYNAMKDRHVNGQWSDFPRTPAQNEVWEWLDHFQKEFLSDARGIYCETKCAADLSGGEARRQLDIFIKRRDAIGKVHDWKDVQVIGEHKQSRNDFKGLLLQLSEYMRDVFTNQPTRRFIHGFFLHGTTMELWVFDRSGPYSSGQFDIHKQPERFIRALAGYALMDDEELGIETFIKCKGQEMHVNVTEDSKGKKLKLCLEPIPLIMQRAIVCRGTSCYRTKGSKYVVKFSWTADKELPEPSLLRQANEKGVEGVPKLLSFHHVTSITDMRNGLVFGSPHTFRNASSSVPSTVSQAQVPISIITNRSRDINEPSSKSRKRQSVGDEIASSKRPRFNSQKSKLFHEHDRTQKSKNRQGPKILQVLRNACVQKRKSNDSEEQPSKRSRSSNQASDTRASNFGNKAPFRNRLLGCLVISPAGEAIGKFESIPKLLTAMRDAIKAHRSLFLVGKILHRDISEWNIITTKPAKAGGFEGMLIDLDLAISVGTRTGARHMTGTMEFMAIEVLQRVDHTYRHDLESFLYVLLWICARRAWERGFGCKPKDQPNRSVLRKWYTGDYAEIAQAKRGFMHVDGFEDILGEFPGPFDSVKPLCREIRGSLFPLKEDGALYVGTPDNPQELYGSILNAYDKALAEIRDAE